MKNYTLFIFCLFGTSCIQSPPAPTQEVTNRSDMFAERITCETQSDCQLGEYCDPCAGGASCPTCDDCIGACVSSSCETETSAVCEIDQPLCSENEVLIIQEGCWLCVDQSTCVPNEEWPIPEPCESNTDCPIGEYCSDCAGSSCPNCEDCLMGCRPQCVSESVVECEVERPNCDVDQITVIREGCWVCVDESTCEPPVDQQICITNAECDLGTYCSECATSSCPDCRDCVGLCTQSSCESEPNAVCEIEQPTCDLGTVLVVRDGCWLCIDPTSCEPMSTEPERVNCENPEDCPFGSICDPCGSSSCPSCPDCISACVPVCESEQESLCFSERPTCEEDEVLIVRNMCWLCVNSTSCEPE